MCALPVPVPSLALASPAEAPFAWLVLAAIPFALAQRYFWRVRKVADRQIRSHLIRLYVLEMFFGGAGGVLLLGIALPWSSAVEHWDSQALVHAPNPCVLAAVNAAAQQARVAVTVLILVSFSCIALGWLLEFRAARLRRAPPQPVEEGYG